MADVKWSQFPSVTPSDSDEVVGLHNDDNARFSVANFILAIRQGLANIFVPLTRTINGKALNNDISLSASDTGAQAKITANGILKGDGGGGVSAATPGTDYQAPLTIDATPTANSTNPVQSGGVYTDVRTRVPMNGMGKNLLDNAYFPNPVNQRGQTSYSGAVYGIDRWKSAVGYTIADVISDGYRVKSSNGSNTAITEQTLENPSQLLGKTVSLTILLSSGAYSYSATVPSSFTNTTIINGANVQLVMTSGGVIVVRLTTNSSAGVVFVSVKLELGTEQTLAHQENGDWVLNEIPDYEYELYRCITSTADPSDTCANKSLATEQQLAYPESGTTASRNYTAGQYIALNGLLYTADTAIASGATFYTSGGNKNLTECVGGGFNSLSNVTNDNVTFSNNITGYTYPGEYHLCKSGNIVVTSIYMYAATGIVGLGTLLCTVPEAFRPSVDRRIATLLTYNNETKVETVVVKPDGEVVTASGGYRVSSWIRVFGMYML